MCLSKILALHSVASRMFPGETIGFRAIDKYEALCVVHSQDAGDGRTCVGSAVAYATKANVDGSAEVVHESWSALDITLSVLVGHTHTHTHTHQADTNVGCE
jgi:hypothetical protein